MKKRLLAIGAALAVFASFVPVHSLRTYAAATSSKVKNSDSYEKSYIEVVGQTVNVRSEAGTHGDVVTTVHKRQQLEYTDVKTVDGTKWYKIAFQGYVGWICGAYVALVSPSTTYAQTSSTASTTNTTTNATKMTANTVALNQRVEVTGRAVNVRTGAGTNYAIITSVKIGQVFEYITVKNVDGVNWYQITVNGYTGWVIGTYVKKVEETATTSESVATTKSTTTTAAVATTKTTAASEYTIQITANVLNVRSDAGTNYQVVTTVKSGQTFSYSDVKTVNGTNWYKITANGCTGWVIGTYIKSVNGTATATKQTTTSKQTINSQSTTAAISSNSYIEVTGGTVNVRAGAGTNYTAVFTVYKGQKLAYSEVKTVSGTNWYKITSNGRTGWVIGTYVKVSGAAGTTASASAGKLEVTGGTVNVRTGAGTNYSVVTTVYKGQKLEYYAERTVSGIKWYNISINGYTGWIIGTYIKKVS